MDEGYILSNKYRKIVFEGIATGEKNIIVIAKKHRIIPNVAKKIAEDLTNVGLLEKKGDFYILTKKGEKIVPNIIG
jgi:predicted transcriptional regulator